MAIRLAAAAAALALSAAGSSADGSETGDARRLAALTPEHFLARIERHDDALDTIATLTTADGFVERRPLLGLAPDDIFLRAFIVKATGRTQYQVYVTARYRGYGWAEWTTANYATRNGPGSARLQKIARLRISCTRRLPCPRSETIGFPIDVSLLRERAAGYVAGAITPWHFKIMARNGDEHLETISAAEIAGLLMAVDAYRDDHHLPAP